MAITASMVKELRETTGAGMMDAKKALIETDGDFEAAIDWLRTKGLAKAAKKSGRVAAEGLVAVAVSDGEGVAIEVNSETDFVAKNSEFQDMVSSFYYLRNNLDTHSLKENDEFDLDMFFDSENYKFKLKYLRREILDSEFGKVPCLVFRPYVQSGRVFNEKESLTIWVSDDDNKLPLLIKADLVVGSLKASLIEFKKLNNSFKIFVE